jgi:hypothetical protein
MGRSVFISYSHAQSQWVTTRLAPLLRASGSPIIRDLEASDAGKAMNPQMDAWVDAGDVMLAVISPEYLASKACQYEWARAVARDPGFTTGRLVPILRAGDVLPPEVVAANPLYVVLKDEHVAESDDAGVNGQWEKVLQATVGELGVSPLAWLDALTRTVELIREQKSVNLVASNPAKWKELLTEATALLGNTGLVDLSDLVNGMTMRCFLQSVLDKLAAGSQLPTKPKGADLLEFSKIVRNGQHARLAVAHFERCWKWKEVDGDLFDALRTHTTRNLGKDTIDLSLIVHSTKAISMLPSHDPVSRWQPVEIILNRRGAR